MLSSRGHSTRSPPGPRWASRPPSRTTTLFAAASLLAGLLVLLRAAISGSFFLSWLPWNLFLAWVPYMIAAVVGRLADHSPHGSGLLVAPTLLWLLFIPNAPYVVTDYVHLRGADGARLAYDAGMIGVFAALSLALGLASLQRMHHVVSRRLGGTWGWAFVGGVSLLCGIGVWMGRVLRWNSWDVLTNPMGLLLTTVGAFLDLGRHLGAVVFSASFGLTLLAAYALWRNLATSMPSRVPAGQGLE